MAWALPTLVFSVLLAVVLDLALLVSAILGTLSFLCSVSLRRGGGRGFVVGLLLDLVLVCQGLQEDISEVLGLVA